MTPQLSTSSNSGSGLENAVLKQLIFEEEIEEKVSSLDNQVEKAIVRLFYLERWGIPEIASLFGDSREAITVFLADNFHSKLAGLPGRI